MGVGGGEQPWGIDLILIWSILEHISLQRTRAGRGQQVVSRAAQRVTGGRLPGAGHRDAMLPLFAWHLGLGVGLVAQARSGRAKSGHAAIFFAWWQWGLGELSRSVKGPGPLHCTARNARWARKRAQCPLVPPPNTRAPRRVVSVSFCGSTSDLVTASHDGTARVWDGEEGTCTHMLSGHTGGLCVCWGGEGCVCVCVCVLPVCCAGHTGGPAVHGHVRVGPCAARPLRAAMQKVAAWC